MTPATQKGDALHCLRCGYGQHGQWLQRGECPPKHCPQCGSQYWYRPPARSNAHTPQMAPNARRQRLPRPGGGWVWVWPSAATKRLEQQERQQLRARQAKRRQLFKAARKLALAQVRQQAQQRQKEQA